MITFLINFWSILGPFSTPKSFKNQSKNIKQIITTTHQQKIKNVKIYMCFTVFSCPRHKNIVTKNHQKSIQKLIYNTSQNNILFSTHVHSISTHISTPKSTKNLSKNQHISTQHMSNQHISTQHISMQHNTSKKIKKTHQSETIHFQPVAGGLDGPTPPYIRRNPRWPQNLQLGAKTPPTPQNLKNDVGEFFFLVLFCPS